MRYLTVKEVASILRYSQSYIYTLIEIGEIPAIKIGNGKKGKVLVPASKLEEYLRKKEEYLTE